MSGFVRIIKRLGFLAIVKDREFVLHVTQECADGSDGGNWRVTCHPVVPTFTSQSNSGTPR